MSKTKIEWTDRTWNPVTGCTKISPACDHCYAERMAKRLAANPTVKYRERYKGFKPTCWPERLTEPLKWKKPQRVFVVSMGDLFHEDIPFDFINRVFEVTQLANRHTYMFLTKRPARVLEYDQWREEAWLSKPCSPWGNNVWLGVTIEHPRYGYRMDALRDIPAGVRFISFEPLLADFSEYPGVLDDCDWCIVGSETGPGARPMDSTWALNLKNQCVNAGIPFFFKGRLMQDGSKCRVLAGQHWEEFPEVKP